MPNSRSHKEKKRKPIRLVGQYKEPFKSRWENLSESDQRKLSDVPKGTSERHTYNINKDMVHNASRPGAYTEKPKGDIKFSKPAKPRRGPYGKVDLYEKKKKK